VRRFRLLDLFCCAGGAGRGYADAGFEVVGVDINDQPRYPFEFRRADVLALDVDFLRSFDAIHASPPCQFATPLRHAPGGKSHPNLIPATRALLEAAGLPYVIENVVGARQHLRSPTCLCGSMFGLGTQGHQLRRHRLFESSFPIRAPACAHTSPVVGVYGGHARNRSAAHGGRGTRDPWKGGHVAACQEAMGIDWMTLDEISEAIPPAYTRFIGAQLLAHLHQSEAA
jgi:DNA (cytosine-5)-methyltransferase 1